MLIYGLLNSVRRTLFPALSPPQDASRLLDMCRQSIVFSDPAGIAACLRVIADDPAAEILRVKNRLSLRHDSTQSAGYRDVAINLRLSTDETRRLGLAGHVCEVQLLLRPFADLKVPSFACAGWSRVSHRIFRHWCALS